MKRLRLFILLFFIAISIPLAFVVWQTYSSLEQEERAQLRYFSETMFDEMEKELADLVQREENRAVDEYGHSVADPADKGEGLPQLSPLSQQKYQDYILGYLQNNADGSMQTPLVADTGEVSEERRALLGRLKEVNRVFNTKKFSMAQPKPAPLQKNIAPVKEEKDESSFSERYLTQSKESPSKTYLGKKQQRVEEITAEQAFNIASENKNLRRDYGGAQKAPATISGQASNVADSDKKRQVDTTSLSDVARQEPLPPKETIAAEAADTRNHFEVEVAPFQSVSITDEQVFIFRRIEINNQIYRQGFVLLVGPLLRHLSASHFEQQPLARFASLQMQRKDQGHTLVQAGPTITHSNFAAERVFPPPFDFLSVTLKANAIPASPARGSLNVALAVLAVFMFFGLLTIYQSVRTIVAMSERRSQFVSSVTHELKTPLTNIRMYIEMLEQGIAATPEREQEYLAILGSESARLSGLINNVLELAKLEKKQRQFHMQDGQLDDVLTEIETIMSQKLQQDGFKLVINKDDIPTFAYDRDVLIQILINLIDNSVKFGRQSAEQEITISAFFKNGRIYLTVSDRGPGIPNHALKKVFDNFYRVDNDLTRTTGGTGIGLALVKKFTSAMGGSVYACNNDGAGCSITLLFPLTSSTSTCS